MKRHTRRYVRRQMRRQGYLDAAGGGGILRFLTGSGALGFVVAMAVTWRWRPADRPVVVLAVLMALWLTWWLTRREG